jgi:hypothetical protein
VKACPYAIAFKDRVDAVEAIAEEKSDGEGRVEDQQPLPAAQAHPGKEDLHDDPDTVLEDVRTAAIASAQKQQRYLIARAKTVSGAVISKIESDRNVLFNRGVSLPNSPVVYDGVAEDREGTVTLVEVKYSDTGRFGFSLLMNAFNMANQFAETLRSDQRKKFHFILIIVLNDTVSLRIANRIHGNGVVTAQKFSFSSEVGTYRYSEVVDAL